MMVVVVVVVVVVVMGLLLAVAAGRPGPQRCAGRTPVGGGLCQQGRHGRLVRPQHARAARAPLRVRARPQRRPLHDEGAVLLMTPTM